MVLSRSPGRQVVQKPACWLMKSEPDVFGWDHLMRAVGQTAPWDGVRNYQARNFMRDTMREGDRVLFYHSSCAEPGIVGIAEVASPARPDPTQWNKKSPGYDPSATRAAPRWWLVDVRARVAMPQAVSLARLREDPGLAEMLVLRRGQRLSIQPVTAEEYARVCRLGGLPSAP